MSSHPVPKVAAMPSLRLVLTTAVLAVASLFPAGALAADDPPGIERVITPLTKRGTVEGGQRVAIRVFSDTPITSATQVLFDGRPGTDLRFSIDRILCTPEAPTCPDSPDDIWIVSVVAPPHPAGKVDLVVQNGDETLRGLSETGDDFTYAAPPSIRSVTPARGPLTGGTRVTLAIDGLWVYSPRVTVGGVPATDVDQGAINVLVPPLDGQRISFTVPRGTKAGAADIEVQGTLEGVWTPVTARGNTATSDDFTYESDGIVDVVEPPGTLAGPIAGGDTVVVRVRSTVPLTGGDTQLWFGDEPGIGTSAEINGRTCLDDAPYCPQPTDDWLVMAKSPAHAAETVDLSVRRGDLILRGVTEEADDYRYAPQPTISSVSPSTGPLAGGTRITIKIDGLWAREPSVTVGGRTATEVNVSGTAGPINVQTIQAVVPAGAAAGIADVEVSGRVDGTPGTTVAKGTTPTSDDFTYEAPAVVDGPKVTGVSGGPVLAGFGGLIAIRGTKLGGLKSVKVGTRTAATLLASSTQIIAFAPAQPKGSYDVTVTTQKGSAVSPTKLAYRSLF